MGAFMGGRRVGFGAVVAVTLLVSVGSAAGASDVTPPSVTLTTPAANAVYAQNSVVKANYSCSDTSGIAACVGTVANGDSIITQKLGTRTFAVDAYDNAGNRTTLARAYTVVDQTAPEITIQTPAAGATYARNSAVFAQFACTDRGSGIASCAGTVPNGSNLPTGTSGAKSFTVNATDKAGNTATKTVSYTIA